MNGGRHLAFRSCKELVSEPLLQLPDLPTDCGMCDAKFDGGRPGAPLSRPQSPERNRRLLLVPTFPYMISKTTRLSLRVTLLS
jgi:hypothetical protein